MNRLFRAFVLSSIVHAALIPVLVPNGAARAVPEHIRVTFVVSPPRPAQSPQKAKQKAKASEPKSKPRPRSALGEKNAPRKTAVPEATRRTTGPTSAAVAPNRASTEVRVSESASGAARNHQAVIDAADLKILEKVSPEYPMISRRRKEEGTVTLIAEVASGRVTSVRVEKSSGHSSLDESAIRALRRWRFDTSGYGESLTVRIPFTFILTSLID